MSQYGGGQYEGHYDGAAGDDDYESAEAQSIGSRGSGMPLHRQQPSYGEMTDSPVPASEHSPYDPSPMGSSLPHSYGAAAAATAATGPRLASPYSQGQSPYPDQTTYASSPAYGPPGGTAVYQGPVQGGGYQDPSQGASRAYQGSPQSQSMVSGVGGGGPGSSGEFSTQQQGQHQRQPSQRRVMFDDSQSVEKFDEGTSEAGAMPQSVASGQLYHSAEFPLGGNPNGGQHDVRGDEDDGTAYSDHDTQPSGGLHQRTYSRTASQRSRGSYRSGSYREGRGSHGGYDNEEDEYYEQEEQEEEGDEVYRRNNTYKRTGTFSRTLTFFGRTLTRTNTMSKTISRTLTRTLTRQYKFDTEEEVEEAAAAMEEARRQRLERGDGPLEDATTKVIEKTAKLARTMTMAVAAPVAKVLEDEQVQKHLNFFKERAMTMATGRPDWDPEPPRVPLPPVCNCCSLFIVTMCALIPLLLYIPNTRSAFMTPFITVIAEPVGKATPETALPTLGDACTSGGYGGPPPVPKGVKSMDSTWFANTLADGAQIQLQSNVNNLWWTAAPASGTKPTAVLEPPPTGPTPSPPPPPSPPSNVPPQSPAPLSPPPQDSSPPPPLSPPAESPPPEAPPPVALKSPPSASPPSSTPSSPPPPSPPPANSPESYNPNTPQNGQATTPETSTFQPPPNRPSDAPPGGPTQSTPGWHEGPPETEAPPPIPPGTPNCPAPPSNCPSYLPWLPGLERPSPCFAELYENMTANIEAGTDEYDRPVQGAFYRSPDSNRVVFCPNVSISLVKGNLTVGLQEGCRPRPYNITIQQGTFFKELEDGSWTSFPIAGMMVRVRPYTIFYNVSRRNFEELSQPCVFRGRMLRASLGEEEALGGDEAETGWGTRGDGSVAGGEVASLAASQGQTGTVGGSGGRLLQGGAPSPLANSPPWGSAMNGTTSGSFSQYNQGALGLYTNKPSSKEFFTVQRQDKNYFFLVAPNQMYLVVDENGTISATAPTKSSATKFNATTIGDRQLVLGLEDGRVVGWGNSTENQCNGLNNAVVARLSTSFISDYNCQGLGYTEQDYYMWRVREVVQVPRVRGMNLGGWLVMEEWMSPDMWNGVPDLVDGWKIQLQSTSNGLFVAATNPYQISCTTPPDKVGILEAWSLQRFNGVATNQIRLRLTSTGQFLIAADNSNGVLSLGPTTPDEVSFRDVFNMTLGSNNNQMQLQDYQGNFITVDGAGVLRIDTSQPNSFSGPTVFNINRVGSVQGEWQISAYSTNAQQTVPEFRNSFIQESDWANLARLGVNTVRIPVGWWISQGSSPDYPFIPGADQVLDNAFAMAQKYNIRVWVSIHAVPGSQYDGVKNPGTASRDGVTGWDLEPMHDQYLAQTLNLTSWIAGRYFRSPAFFGIGLMNEPSEAISLPSLLDYYTQAYHIVRQYSPCVYVGIMPRMKKGSVAELHGFMDSVEFSNVVIELHNYNVFDTDISGNSSSAAQYDYVINNYGAELQTLAEAGRTVLVGEWSLALNDTLGFSPGVYNTFGQVQMLVYDTATAGWFFWSYKVATNNPNWSLQNALQKGWLMYY